MRQNRALSRPMVGLTGATRLRERYLKDVVGEGAGVKLRARIERDIRYLRNAIRTLLRFAFDETPREAFELNDRQLPFGAHAWYKHDRAFWEPYLLP